GLHAANRLEHVRRAAASVLVEVQPQPLTRTRIALDFHESILTATELAWAVSPSAVARSMTVLPTPASPARVTRCTVICRTKSAADSPPRTRAAPAVGST